VLVRRCNAVTIESRERIEFSLEELSRGGAGLRASCQWVASVPHAASECVLSDKEVHALGRISPSRWQEWDVLAAVHDVASLEGLLEKQLLVAKESTPSQRDLAVRDAHWNAISASAHYASRWQGKSTAQAQRELVEFTGKDLLDQIGVPPPPVKERAASADRLKLPQTAKTPLDALLDARVTCRNFKDTGKLALADFAAVLYRAFGARTVNDYAPGIQLLKKGVPSAGGLHPTEAYLLVQHVEGIASGLYHYHPVDHALEPIRALSQEDARETALRFVAAQDYFSDAHVLVMPTSRFARNFWKYRNHAKAYRALILDVGHLSQAMYLAATELGLAAFITAAINEVDIEQAFGLDPLEEGPLAVCGFGIRAAQKAEVEFDPLGAVWGEATA